MKQTWQRESDIFPKASVPSWLCRIRPDPRIKGSSPPAAFLEGERQKQVSNSSKVGTAYPQLRKSDPKEVLPAAVAALGWQVRCHQGGPW